VDVLLVVFRCRNGRKEKNIAAFFMNVSLASVLLSILGEALAPGTESMRMLKHVKIHTAFRNVFLRIATSF
jgi:hypothetical protein